MKEILYNYDNLSKDQIDETIIRTKAVIVNNNEDIILGYSHKLFSSQEDI